MTAPAVSPPQAGPQPGVPQRFKALLAPLDTMSGDGRMIASYAGEVRVRPLPLPLLYQESLEPGHDGAVVIGALDTVWAEDGQLWGGGDFDMADPVAVNAVRRISAGYVRGVSVDLDDVTAEVRCMRDGQVIACPDLDEDLAMAAADPMEGVRLVEVAVDWRLMDATVVSQAAFAEAYIMLDPPAAGSTPPGTGQGGDEGFAAADTEREDEEAGLPTFTVTGDTSLPIADREHEWDAAGADSRQAAAAGGVDDLDPARFARGHFWRDPDADPATVGAYKLPFADMVNGQLQAVPRGVFAVAGSLQGSRGGPDIPQSDVDGIKGKVGTYYRRMAEKFGDPSITPPWEDAADSDSGPDAARVAAVHDKVSMARRAHLVAAAGARTGVDGVVDLWRPPRTWFDDPRLDQVTPLTVDPDGRVYGHLARWYDEQGMPACHVGFGDVCVPVPHSSTGYRYFHTGHIDTDTGPLAVGTITVGCAHAPDHQRVSWAQACEFYADSGNGAAVGRAGEDEHGIWFAGAVTPTATREQVYTLQRTTISPDWREIGGNLEMIAGLGVNTGGFPMPRVRLDGLRPVALVAAGVVRRTRAATIADNRQVVDEVVRQALAGVGRVMRARTLAAGVRSHKAARLAAHVHGRSR